VDLADCALAETDRGVVQATSSTLLDDGVARPCKPLQPPATPHHHHHQLQQQQQQQPVQPATYKWMTVKRGPPKTTGESFVSIHYS